MELNRWTVLLPKRSVQTVEVERFVCKCACRSLPSNSTDVEVYPVHVFNLRGPKIVSLGHLFKIINLTTFPTLRATFENSTKGQLAAGGAASYPGASWDFLWWSRRNGSREGQKIRTATSLFTLSLPLWLCVLEVSHDRYVATTV